MKELFQNRYFNKYLPLYIIILTLVVLLGTSYALLRSSHTSSEAYTMNVGLLEVNFFGTTNTLSINNMVPMTDEEGMKQNDNVLNFTVKNTGQIKADYSVYIEETSTSPEFKSVIRYAVNKADSGYGNTLKLTDNMLYIDKDQTLDVGGTVNYKVKFWLDYDADNTYMNKTFTARIVITSKQWEKIGFRGTAAQLVSQASKYELETTPFGIIYPGENPDNYVLFNNEQWRIIGIYGDKYKIVKASPIKDENDMITMLQYNIENNSNAWSGSTIQTYLANTYYLTLSETAKNMIYENAIWNVGAVAKNETSSSAYLGAQNLPWSGKIGLVASYEYLYAAGDDCRDIAGTSDFQTENCSANDWLWSTLTNEKNYNGWLVNPRFGNTSDALLVNYRSGAVGDVAVSNARSASPVVYLQSDVTITGGNGISGDEYTLSCLICS